MDAKELRLGNFVFDKYGNVETVNEVSKHGELYRINELDPAYFHPIPLTVEWFEMLGFIRLKNGLELDCGNGIRINSLFTGIPLTLEVHGMRSPLYDIISVHQIQNLFYLLNQNFQQ